MDILLRSLRDPGYTVFRALLGSLRVSGLREIWRPLVHFCRYGFLDWIVGVDLGRRRRKFHLLRR